MGAPILIETQKTQIDPLRISLMEYDQNVIPITVKRVKEISRKCA